MLLIKKAHRGFRTVYERRYYHSPTNPHAGWFGFECDEQGNVFTERLEDVALDNYVQASATSMVNGHPVYGGEVHSYEVWESNCAVGMCNRCDRSVLLNQYSSKCECGAEYDIVGNELIPHQWKDTSESVDSKTDYITDLLISPFRPDLN
jgi:hypothetical protein